MATKVSFIIKLRDRVSRPANVISRKFKKIQKNAKQLSKTIRTKLNKSLGSLKGKLIGIATTIAAGFGFAKLISEGAAFQDAIADLSSITGTAGKELQFLSDESLRLAKSSSIAQVEVAKAFKDIASAKSELLKDPKGLSIVTEQALLLANAAGISVPDAVRASVGALNQFDKGAEDAARFVNVLAAGAKVGASSVANTAEALKNAGTVASQFGLSFEQTNAILQVFAKSELKAGEAGTALRGVLVRLEKFRGGQLAPSKIGIIKSLEIIKKLGLTNNQIIAKFGVLSLQSILILRKQIPLIKQWTKELTGTNVAQEQAAVRLATFNAKVGSLGISINDTLIKAFLRLEPTIKKEVLNLTNFFDTLSPEQIDAFADKLGSLVKGVSALGKALFLLTKPLVLIADIFSFIGIGIGENIAQRVQLLTGEQFALDVVAKKREREIKLIREAALAKGVELPSEKTKELLSGKNLAILDNQSKSLATLAKKTESANIASSSAIINLEKDKGIAAPNAVTQRTKSTTTIDLNIRAPKDVVKSVQTRETGASSDLNMGINMLVAT